MIKARFVLMTPEIGNSADLLPRLAAALGTGGIAAVIVRTGYSEKAVLTATTNLVQMVQNASAAALLHSPPDPRLVARLNADGAYYSYGDPGLRDAISELKPDRIVGVGNLRTRHEAMEMGEADIDYIMFGEPRADGYVPEMDKTVDRAGWWAEIFNIPCVAYAQDVTAVTVMAATGAEFIGLGPWVLDDDPVIALHSAHEALENRKASLK